MDIKPRVYWLHFKRQHIFVHTHKHRQCCLWFLIVIAANVAVMSREGSQMFYFIYLLVSSEKCCLGKQGCCYIYTLKIYYYIHIQTMLTLLIMTHHRKFSYSSRWCSILHSLLDVVRFSTLLNHLFLKYIFWRRRVQNDFHYCFILS